MLDSTMQRRNITPTQFAYWLQGALEIEEIKTLSENQIAKIRQRLDDVVERDGYCSSIWLMLAILSPSKATDAIKQIQSDTFVHDIDPTYDGDQQFFHRLHYGEEEPT
jgi:hypothetical protein